MSTEFFLRVIFMFIFAIAGGIWGYNLADLNNADIIRYTLGLALVGALVGLILTPYFTTRPGAGHCGRCWAGSRPRACSRAWPGWWSAC